MYGDRVAMITVVLHEGPGLCCVNLYGQPLLCCQGQPFYIYCSWQWSRSQCQSEPWLSINHAHNTQPPSLAHKHLILHTVPAAKYTDKTWFTNCSLLNTRSGIHIPQTSGHLAYLLLTLIGNVCFSKIYGTFLILWDISGAEMMVSLLTRCQSKFDKMSTHIL